MGDIALVWDQTIGAADFSLTDFDLTSEEGMRTAALLSLFTDRRASAGESLPGADDDLRGWWGDEFLEDDGDLTGSLLWLLERAKMTEGLASAVESHCRQALQWMLDDFVAQEIRFDHEIRGQQLLYQVEIFHGDSSTKLQFEHVWEGEAARGTTIAALAANAILTEAGDTLITEAGDTLTTE